MVVVVVVVVVVVEASVGLACPRVSWGSIPLPISGDKADDLAFDQA